MSSDIDFDNVVKDIMTYDVKKKKFKSLLAPILIFTILMLIIYIVTYFIHVPGIILISFFACAIATVTYFHDHWILNSATLPLIVIILPVVIADFASLSILSLILHFMTMLCIFGVFPRKNTSLVGMTCASIIYGLWVYAIKEWVMFPYYDTLLMPNDIAQTIFIIIGGLAISFIKTWLSMRHIKKGNTVECDLGACPF